LQEKISSAKFEVAPNLQIGQIVHPGEKYKFGEKFESILPLRQISFEFYLQNQINNEELLQLKLDYNVEELLTITLSYFVL
jgi:hypothetical protein